MFGQGIFRFPLTDASFTLLNRSWTNFRFGMLITMAWLVWKQKQLQIMFPHLLQKFEMYLKYIHKKHLHLLDMSCIWMRKSSKHRNHEALKLSHTAKHICLLLCNIIENFTKQRPNYFSFLSYDIEINYLISIMKWCFAW